MKIPFILTGGLVLLPLLTIVACNRRAEVFQIGKGTAPAQILHIGVYEDPQHSGKCDLTYPKANVRQVDAVQWDAIDSNNYTAHFPAPSAHTSGTPFGAGNDKFDAGQKTPTPAVPAGKYYAYEILINGNSSAPCKVADDPNDDPGLNIKN